MFKLRPLVTKHEFSMGDKSGYKYEIRTEFLQDRGSHMATVLFRSFGSSSPESAIAKLQPAAEHFLRQLQENGVEPVDELPMEMIGTAINALRSYELGNASPDLAGRIANTLQQFIDEQRNIKKRPQP
jgi:hypothetical protein